MEVKHAMGVRAEAVSDPQAKGARIRWLIGPDSGAPTFHMRQFEILPGGHTPHHSHPWEHEVYILEGQGKVISGGKPPQTVKTGDVVYVPPGEEHQFLNEHWSRLVFLCLIPKPQCECKG